MWKYDINDPNDPNNPFGRCYKPRYVYEKHIVHLRPKQPQPSVQPSAVEETPVKNNPKMVVPYVEVDTPISEIPLEASTFYWNNRLYISAGTMSLSFKGEIKAQEAILKVNFEGSKPKIAAQFQADGNKALNNVSTSCNFDFNDLQDSSFTATVNNSPYNSTSVNVSGGIPSIDVSNNDNGAGSSGVTLSPVGPTVLTFHFDTEDFKTRSGDSSMKGHLHLEINLTISPANGDQAAPSPSMSTSAAWSEIKSKVKEWENDIGGAVVNGDSLIPITFIPITQKNPIMIINGIVQSAIQALMAPSSGDDDSDPTIPPPPVPEFIPA